MSEYSMPDPKWDLNQVVVEMIRARQESLKTPSDYYAEGNYASEFYNQLIKWISAFDAQLDSEHEVGVRLVSFGQAITFYLTAISYSNPSLITFFGNSKEGEPVQLIQHVSQISVLLTKLQKCDPHKPKRHLGFVRQTNEEPDSEKTEPD